MSRKTGDGPRQAVVLSGGGATGAYEIGILEGLYEAGGAAPAGFAPDIFSGTSVGSFNAAFMASPEPGEAGASTVGRLKTVWQEIIAGKSELGRNGVFRIRGDVLPFLSPSVLAKDPAKPLSELAGDGWYLATDTLSRLAFFGRKLSSSPLQSLGQLLQVPDLSALISTEPMADLIRGQIDLARLRSSSLDFRCVATDWTHGKPCMFTKDEMTDEEGHDILRASAAIPAIFPEVVIGGIHYVDGGILMNTPLEPAIDAWRGDPERCAELELHVIYLDPTLADQPLPEVSSTLSVTARLITSLLAYNVNTHVESAGRVNPEIRRQLAEAGISGAATSAAGSGAQLEKPLLRIHRYRPSAAAAGGVLGVLEFTTDRIDGLIQQGYQDARSHDCAKEGCVTLATG